MSLYLLPPALAVEVIEMAQSVYVCLGLWDLCCAPIHWYMITLCTIDLHFAPLTCTVHNEKELELTDSNSIGVRFHKSIPSYDFIIDYGLDSYLT